MNGAVWMWAVLLVGFLIVEGACPLHLVSIWFAAGSLVAAVVALLGGPMWLQVLLFLAVSGTLLALLWPLVKKCLQPSLVKTNADALIGTEGIVINRINNLEATGNVKLSGMEWSARSTDGSVIEPGTTVTVDRIEGVKVFVTPVKVTVNLS